MWKLWLAGLAGLEQYANDWFQRILIIFLKSIHEQRISETKLLITLSKTVAVVVEENIIDKKVIFGRMIKL